MNKNLKFFIREKQILVKAGIKKNILFLLLFLLSFSLNGFANSSNNQDPIVVTGTVRDSFGNPLPGVTILEKGTQNGQSTDFDGQLFH